jgi:hypothetical protein
MILTPMVMFLNFKQLLHCKEVFCKYNNIEYFDKCVGNVLSLLVCMYVCM